MKQIWKYELDLDSDQAVLMKKGAKILSVQMQNDSIRLWALVSPNEETEFRYISVYGTGWDMPDDPGKYISTMQTKSGMVFHAFESNKKEVTA